MFSDKEIHRIAGHLYLATRAAGAEIVLGDRIEDVASQTKRDLDIVVLASASTAMMGVEVKNEERPLDTPLVEGLCAKLNDMPSITRRQIVSASGYTRHARSKAAAHGVECLSIRNGPLPDFDFVDLTQLRHCNVARRGWREAAVTLVEENPLSPQLLDRLRSLSGATELVIGASTLTMAEFAKRALAGVVDKLGPTRAHDDTAIDAVFPLDARVVVQVDDEEVAFNRVHVRGVVQITNVQVPLHSTIYLVGEDERPVSAGVLVELDEMLIGLTAASGVGALGVFSIPTPLRTKTPHKERIRRGSQSN